MAEQAQSFESHSRWIPLWHFFAFPVLMINVVVTALHLIKEPTLPNAWLLIVAIALTLGIFFSRTMPLRAQDRLIRFEERTRLGTLLPADLRGRVNELTPSQLVALRFAPDDEAPDLARRCLNGELKTRSDIKRAIKSWRADHFRV